MAPRERKIRGKRSLCGGWKETWREKRAMGEIEKLWPGACRSASRSGTCLGFFVVRMGDLAVRNKSRHQVLANLQRDCSSRDVPLFSSAFPRPRNFYVLGPTGPGVDGNMVGNACSIKYDDGLDGRTRQGQQQRMEDG